MLSCYNRGCGKDFDPANNPDGKRKCKIDGSLCFELNENFPNANFKLLNLTIHS